MVAPLGCRLATLQKPNTDLLQVWLDREIQLRTWLLLDRLRTFLHVLPVHGFQLDELVLDMAMLLKEFLRHGEVLFRVAELGVL